MSRLKPSVDFIARRSNAAFAALTRTQIAVVSRALSNYYTSVADARERHTIEVMLRRLQSNR